MRIHIGASKHLMVQRHFKLWNDRFPWKRLLHSSVLSRPPALHNCGFSRLPLHGTKFAVRRGFRTGIISSSSQSQSWCRVVRLVGKTAAKYIWRQSAGVLLGAVCLVQKFDFENNGITDADVERCREANEIAGIKALIEATVTCPVCGKRQVLQEEVPGVEYCVCKDGGGVEWERSYDGWQPFLERQNILVWRRPHQAWPHLFAYKVYGRYDDVSLCAFVETQLSTTYRTEWDPSALDLRILHSDAMQDQTLDGAADKNKAYSAQDLLYWLVKFPSFFANRDYVFKRRYRADVARQEVVIVSEAAPSRCGVDEVAGVHRVHDYWSVMVVRASNSDFTQPGIEYVLSYFDNPGTSLPASITNFIASTSFPNFLKRLHTASLAIQHQHEAGRPVYMSLPSVLLEAGRAAALQPEQILQASGYEDVEEQLRKRGSTLDDSTIQYLMEALGEIVPSPAEPGPLMLRLDAMISDALDKLDEKNPLVAKIKVLKNKLDHFRSKTKIKKEESLGEMKNLVIRHGRYEDGRLQPTPPVLVRHLFENMKAVLKADHDMKTGRGLLTADDDDKTISNQSRAADSLAKSNAQQATVCCEVSQCHSVETSPVENAIQEAPRSNISENDGCEKESESSSSNWKTWLYSTFVEAPSNVFSRNRGSDKSQTKEKPDSPPNSNEEKSKCESEESGTESEPIFEEQSSSFWYYVYGWIFWPVVVRGQSSCEGARAPDEGTDELVNGDDPSKDSDCTTEPRSSWYWTPVRGISWIFSYLTNSKL